MTKIVYLDARPIDIGDLDWTALLQCGTLELYDHTPPNLIVERSKDAEILIVNKVVISREILAQLPSLKYIVVSATGFNIIDTQACKELGILVSNVSGYSTMGVAQHVFAVLLNYLHNPAYYEARVSMKQWHSSVDFCFYDHSIRDLADMSLGVVAYGNIGQQVAAIGSAFGMQVLVYNKYGSNRSLGHNIQEVDLETIWQECDVISLHAPLNSSSKEMINKTTLAKMKKDVILINSSRGGLVNEDDLADYLDANPYATALLDVVTYEPPKQDTKLFNLPNCRITPHIAWASRDSRSKLMNGIVQNIIAWKNEDPINVVNR
jgi:glycerate dehydrogenase